MEFKNGELVEREIEIALYLFRGFSLSRIVVAMGLSEIMLIAHLRNMMKKLQVDSLAELIQFLRTKEL